MPMMAPSCGASASSLLHVQVSCFRVLPERGGNKAVKATPRLLPCEVMFGTLVAASLGNPWSGTVLATGVQPTRPGLRCPMTLSTTARLLLRRRNYPSTSATNGLARRSTAMVEPGPWPQMNDTSSPSGSSLPRIDCSSAAPSP